jgi:hypothetical protein
MNGGGAASFDVFSGRKGQRGAESEESSSEEEDEFIEDDGGKSFLLID